MVSSGLLRRENLKSYKKAIIYNKRMDILFEKSVLCWKGILVFEITLWLLLCASFARNDGTEVRGWQLAGTVPRSFPLSV
jgi:hypothetical protein